ncbi:MAG: hypothetical protein DRP93_03930 [Candidatus Neomarinimicrobiota bacterium]|nr:MAG: hypothetical protein DRP93_03930 [Candidatus Neomarinimicrobiota bacterium]
MKRIIIMMIIGLTILQAQVPEKIRSKSIPLGVGLSIVLPGAGQLYNGNTGAGIIYLAMEATFITGTAYFKHQGDMGVEEYEDYADVHWNVSDWLNVYDPAIHPTTHHVIVYIDHRSYSPENETDYTAMMTDIENGCTTKSIVKDYHFYENIGKYQQFKQGWDDWYPGSEDLDAPSYGIYASYSPNQFEYSSMRREANKLLDFGTYFGTAIFLNHFMSAIDAGFRIKKGNDNQEILITLHTAPVIKQNGTSGLQTGLSVIF